MSAERDRILAANERYAAAFGHGDLTGPPRRRLAVVTCMDARFDPLQALGLSLGDAHVLRNAGAQATDDVLRSLALSHRLLGTQEALVIGHTDCGLGSLAEDEIHRAFATAGLDTSGIVFRAFADLEEAVRDAVRTIRESPLLPPDYGAEGFVFDVRSGRLRPVDEPAAGA
jgi:carbonic anhydrase